MATPEEIIRRKANTGGAAAALGAKPVANVVPAGPATVSPVAANINEQMRAERARVSPLAKEINSVVAAPRPPPATTLPAYRTPDGFQQTPAPVNPNPRAALGAEPVPASSIPSPSGAAARAPGALGRRISALKPGKAGAAGLVLEGLNIAGAAQRDGVVGAAGETAAAGTRLGAARLGAELGRKIPFLPTPWKVAAGAVGGLAGYAGGQELVDQVRNHTPQSVADAVETANFWGARSGNTLIPGMGDAMFGADNRPRMGPMAEPRKTVADLITGGAPAPVTGPVGSAAASALGGSLGMVGNQGGRLVSTQPAAPAPPAAATAAGKQPVIGTYQAQGRPQRQVFADGTVSATTAPVNGAYSTIPAYQGTPTAAARLGAPSVSGPDQFADSERRQYQEQLDAQIKGLGNLDMRSKRELLGQLLGLKGRSVGQAFDASAGRGVETARLGQSAAEAQLGADVQREGIAAGERSSRRAARKTTQTITGADGTMYSLDGTVAAPITTADGKNVAAATKPAKNEQAAIAAALLETLIPPGATPDEIKAAARQANSAAAALMSGTGAQSASKPSEADFLKSARSANPGVSDADLKAYYQQTYGS